MLPVRALRRAGGANCYSVLLRGRHVASNRKPLPFGLLVAQNDSAQALFRPLAASASTSTRGYQEAQAVTELNQQSDGVKEAAKQTNCSETNSDDKPFHTLLQALSLYRKVYGNIQVPVRFTVPSAAEEGASQWPEEFHGYRLGPIITKVREHGLYIRGMPERRKLLEAVGLECESRSYDKRFQRLVEAFTTYVRIHGKTVVPRRFVVPLAGSEGAEDWPVELHGYRLGEIIHDVRYHQRYVKDRPDRQQELENVGLNWRRRDQPIIDTFIDALKVYKAKYGHCAVPRSFMVPKDGDEGRWPQQHWGLPLGNMARSLRERKGRLSPARRQELEAVGFVWDQKPLRPIETILGALEQYKSKYGHIEVERRFVVPSDPSIWPDHRYHGLDLGERLHQMREDFAYLDKSSDTFTKLARLGFRWQHTKKGNEAEGWREGASSLETISVEDAKLLLHHFKQRYGHTRVPHSFVVPTTPAPSSSFADFSDAPSSLPMSTTTSQSSSSLSWPRHLAGFPFGKLLQSKSYRRTLLDRVAGDQAFSATIGYEWVFRSRHRESMATLLEAVRTFKELYGHTDVHYTFEVPYSEDWEPKLHGLALGRIMLVIRMGKRKIKDQEKEELEKMGFSMLSGRKREFELFYTALEQFKALHGHIHVPSQFVIPPKSEQYPETLWGYKLGTTVTRVRQRNSFLLQPEQRQRLVELGFQWGVQTSLNSAARFRMFQVAHALSIYGRIYGHYSIPEGYVITSTSPEGQAEEGKGCPERQDVDEPPLSFPEYLHGLELGKAINFLPSRRKEGEADRTTLARSLAQYFEKHGDASIPMLYVVPEAECFDDDLHGTKLGLLALRMRRHLVQEMKEEEEELDQE